MGQGELMEYWLAIDVLEAREYLLSLKIVCHPHRKPAEQKKFSDYLFKVAYPEYKNVKTLSSSDFARIASAKMGKR